MMAQERQQRERRPRDPSGGPAPVPRVAESAAVSKIDDLLDEIDSVLEENAEEFVKNYVQKGGE
ncbi:MAG: ubiquitin-like protein Pup [bacterium]|nr:ubiquitin-like protein Pup [bacterium]MDE0287770.1 ubiquitin-like protein Pup [bacterium]MDE0439313.1 ubiquitin-like protein Pup [bacterium]